MSANARRTSKYSAHKARIASAQSTAESLADMQDYYTARRPAAIVSGPAPVRRMLPNRMARPWVQTGTVFNNGVGVPVIARLRRHY